jgi:hypothetical protein
MIDGGPRESLFQLNSGHPPLSNKSLQKSFSPKLNNLAADFPVRRVFALLPSCADESGWNGRRRTFRF